MIVKIVVDSAIPFVAGLFEPYAEVIYLPCDKIDCDIIKDADALIIRTRTRCDRGLLEGSAVRHIATATIGYDHIDLAYCQSVGIKVSTAAGCNARGVLQWVGAALMQLSRRDGWSPEERTVGVVGVGNVGRLIEQYCRLWGFNVLCCDPPRGVEGFITLEELLPRVDILTLHTPLDQETFHMINSENISLLPPHAAIINTSRGEVVDSEALISHPSYRLLFDVWEGEPNIDRGLLDRALVSTPHIAGYSLQGKSNATAMVVAGLCESFDIPLQGWYPPIERTLERAISWGELGDMIEGYFDIEGQSAELKSAPEHFEQMRNSYDFRCEFF